MFLPLVFPHHLISVSMSPVLTLSYQDLEPPTPPKLEKGTVRFDNGSIFPISVINDEIPKFSYDGEYTITIEGKSRQDTYLGRGQEAA